MDEHAALQVETDGRAAHWNTSRHLREAGAAGFLHSVKRERRKMRMRNKSVNARMNLTEHRESATVKDYWQYLNVNCSVSNMSS